jgi:hypothetical protein
MFRLSSKPSEAYYLRVQRRLINIFLKYSLKYRLIKCFKFFLYFLFKDFKPYLILCISKIFLAGPAQSNVPNITNTSHSQHSSLMLFYQHTLSFIICNNSVNFQYFSFHKTKKYLVQRMSVTVIGNIADTFYLIDR